MAYVLTLLKKFGFIAPKADTSEAFSLRLTRIGTREARRDVQAAVFVKNPV